MKSGSDLLKYFDEQTSAEERRRIEESFSDRERQEFELMREIWEQADTLNNYGAFSTSSAWENMERRIKSDEAQSTVRGQEIPLSSRRQGKTVPLRWVYAAAAILLILVVGTRFLMRSGSEPSVVSFNSYDKARIYAFESMFDIAEGVMGLAQDGAFEEYTYARAGDRFDSETNVLIRDILGEKSKSRAWKRALGKFSNIDGANYYPQVYLFDYENYMNKASDPLAVIYVSDDVPPEGEYVYDAYRFEKGRLEFYKRIGEAEARREKVWVFSLNENVNSQGELPSYDPDLTANGALSVSAKVANGRLDKVGIYDPKESWAGGASEVYVRRFFSSLSGLNSEGEVTGFEPQNSRGIMQAVRVRSFARTEVSERRVVEVDFPLTRNWDVDEFNSDAVVMTIVLYEHDVWPNGINTGAYRLANGEQRFLSYSSAQEYFDIARVFGVRSPAGWMTTEYPNGIPDTLLIDNFVEDDDPEIFYNTERY